MLLYWHCFWKSAENYFKIQGPYVLLKSLRNGEGRGGQKLNHRYKAWHRGCGLKKDFLALRTYWMVPYCHLKICLHRIFQDIRDLNLVISISYNSWKMSKNYKVSNKELRLMKGVDPDGKTLNSKPQVYIFTFTKHHHLQYQDILTFLQWLSQATSTQKCRKWLVTKKASSSLLRVKSNIISIPEAYITISQSVFVQHVRTFWISSSRLHE